MSSSFYSGEDLNQRRNCFEYDKKGRLILQLKTGPERLTKRESEILKYILHGYSAKQIALLLRISFRTVESYTGVLKLKLGCFKKNDLIVLCMGLGLFGVFF